MALFAQSLPLARLLQPRSGQRLVSHLHFTAVPSKMGRHQVRASSTNPSESITMDNFELQNYQLIMQLRAKVDEVRKLASTTDTGLYDAIDQLETDIGRGLLKLYAVIELLIEKGVITSGDLAAKSAELDDMDGNVDGKLHPAYFRTTEENERQLTTQAYLRKLQSKVFESPQQFLARLEREASDPAN